MNPYHKITDAALSKEGELVLLMGSGVAKDAGIHTGWDLMIKTAGLVYVAETDMIDPGVDLKEWFLTGKYARMKYMDVLAKVTPSRQEQISFVHNYLDNKDINIIYKGLADLINRRILAAVITVNFDHYLEKALAAHRLQTQIITSDEDINNMAPLAHSDTIRIYKPYGDIDRGAIKNTPADLEQLSPLMEKELINIITEHTLVILSYSGGHDLGMQRVFKGRGFSYHEMFYVNPKPPSGEMADILRTKEYVYVNCPGASKFILDFIEQLEKE
jgi:hypothetical protein